MFLTNRKFIFKGNVLTRLASSQQIVNFLCKVPPLTFDVRYFILWLWVLSLHWVRLG